jgi:steroid delta-isomerase-like uncharacterized protein
VVAAVVCAGLGMMVVGADTKSGNESLVRRYVGVWNSGDLATVNRIIAANVVRQGPAASFSARGRDELKAMITQVRTDYPDLRVTMDELEDRGDHVVVSWSVRATYGGTEFPEAVGRKVKTTGTSLYRVAGGKIVAETVSWDHLGVNEQLGIRMPMEAPDDNVALVRRFLEDVYGKGDMDAAYEIVAEDHVFHVPAGTDYESGRDGVQRRVAMFRAALPDLSFRIGETFASQDLVAMSWTFSGTHQGPFMGVGPTGKRVAINGLSMARVRDGKIVETWGYWDTGQLYKQLGTHPH